MPNERWNSEQTIRALYLYFQLPFGRLHHRAPEIIRLANELGRTPSSIAMKLGNLASLDPKITSTGRRGLQGASALDREIFARFYGNWEKLVASVEQLPLPKLIDQASTLPPVFADSRRPFRPFEGTSETERTIVARRGQSFFRNAVLANYDEQCCVTGISDRRLLNASHIRPWDKDVENRHNPANGLALSATFDRAFDRGLMTVDQSLRAVFSDALLNHASVNTRQYFQKYHLKPITAPVRFEPDLAFLEWHSTEVFDQAS